jgi:hypothetical protein
VHALDGTLLPIEFTYAQLFLHVVPLLFMAIGLVM